MVFSKIFIFFLIICLFSCSSFDKRSAYDSVIIKEEPEQRTLASYKEFPKIDGEDFNFISEKMETVINNYKTIKSHLTDLEKKLNQALGKLAEYESKTNHMSFGEEGQSDWSDEQSHWKSEIAIRKKNNEELVIPLSNSEDYKSLIGQIIVGDYDIDKEEETRVLSLVREKFQQARQLEEESDLETSQSFNEADESPAKESAVDLSSTKEEKKPDSSSYFLHGKNNFKNKSYEQAISQLQKYRNNNPKGSYYSEATFYIGKSFENLKMPIEAKSFFKELTESYPDSFWARLARKSLEK